VKNNFVTYFAAFLFAAFLVFSGLLLLSGCDGFFGPDNLAPIITSKEKVKFPIAIAFIEASGKKNVSDEVKVTLLDPQGKVLSPNGFRIDSIIVTEGVMSLAFNADTKVSNTAPYRFVLKAEAKGYYPAIQEVVIDQEGASYVPVYLINTEVAPEGMKLTETSVKLLAEGRLGQSLQITSGPFPGGMAMGSGMSVSVGENTRFFSKNAQFNQPSRLRANLLYAPPGTESSNRICPGGYMTTNAYAENGKRLATLEAPLYFLSAGWFTLEMDADGTDIDSFSQPVEVTIVLNDTLTNPKTGKFIRSGDTIPVWHLREKDGAWLREGKFVVQQDIRKAGPLFLTFPLSHLSTIVVAPTAAECSSDLGLTYQSGFNGGQSYYTTLMNASNGQYLKREPRTFPAAGAALSVSRAPLNVNLLMMARENETTTNANSRFSTTINCNGAQTGNFPDPVALPKNQCLKVEFRKIGNSNFFSLCNNTVWHKDTCSEQLFSLANYLPGEAGVIIPNTPLQGQKCIRLWYSNGNAINPKQVYLQFQVDLTVPIGQTRLEQGQKMGGTFEFNYIIQNTQTAECGNRLTIYVSDNLLQGGCN